jgi:hypothetical protein
MQDDEATTPCMQDDEATTRRAPSLKLTTAAAAAVRAYKLPGASGSGRRADVVVGAYKLPGASCSGRRSDVVVDRERRKECTLGAMSALSGAYCPEPSATARPGAGRHRCGGETDDDSDGAEGA